MDNTKNDIENDNQSQESKLLTKSNILIIFILFMFSSKLWDITWDIIKSLFLIVVILYILNYLNPTIGVQIKDMLYNLLNVGTENKFVKDTLSAVSKSILDTINSKEKIINTSSEEKSSKFKSTSLTSTSTNGDSWVVNRQLDPISKTGNRRLD